MTNLDPRAETLFEHDAMRMKPCRHGVMLYNTHDVYIGRAFDIYGEYAQSEMELLAHFIQPGQIVMDIGANIGAHTLYFAQTVGPEGRVVSFEPQRQVFQTLCANVALNNLNNVLTFHAGAGEAPGTAMVPIPDYAKEGNFGGVSLLGGQGGEAVQVMTLDQIGVPALSLVKIDVEGMELSVLKGAAQSIAQHKPVLYVENDRKDKSPALIDYILGLGYRAYWHIAPLFNPNNAFAHAENMFGNTVSLNLLCIPAQAVQDIKGLAEIQSIDEFPI